MRFLREKKGAHFVLPVLENQPTLFNQLDSLDWQAIPITCRTEQRARGRHEVRTIQVMHAPDNIMFPHVKQVFLVERSVTVKGKTTHTAFLYITSLTTQQATPADLSAYVRGHWTVEVTHWVRDVTFAEDASRVRTGNSPQSHGNIP